VKNRRGEFSATNPAMLHALGVSDESEMLSPKTGILLAGVRNFG